MTHSEKVSWLIQQLIKENPGYHAVGEPVDERGKRRLLRSLMNVRWPKEADEEVLKIQDELLQEELQEKGIIYRRDSCYCKDIPLQQRKKRGPYFPLAGRYYKACGGRHSQCGKLTAAGMFCALPWLY